MSRSFPSHLARSAASGLSRVDSIQRSLDTEDAVPQPRTILLAESDARLRAHWRVGLAAMGFHVRESADALLIKPVPLGRLLQVAARLATGRGRSRGELRVSPLAERPE